MKNFTYTTIAMFSLLITLASCTADEIKTEPKTTIVKQDVSAVVQPLMPQKR
jgi:hypothetical protein